tara:strand:- start:100 stop:465 length:366 start_codon:yes stop_codon:yes gene_type:complete
MDTTNLNSAIQFMALGLIMEKANEIGYTIGDDTLIGYNQNSGYIWVYDESETYTLGITDFAFNRGDCVEFIVTCYVNGNEFIADSLKEVFTLYQDYAFAAVEAGDLDVDEIMTFDLVTGLI